MTTPRKPPPNKLDLTGQRFGKLIVISQAPPQGPKKQSAWNCKCDCGNDKIVKTEYLRNGDVKSCGCQNIESLKARKGSKYKSKYSPLEVNIRTIWLSRYNDGDLTYEDFYQLIQQNCSYCDSLPKNECKIPVVDENSKYTDQIEIFYYNGLDRVNSDLPHNKDNVVPCCKRCNWAKNNRTFEEFKNWVGRVYLYQKNKI